MTLASDPRRRVPRTDAVLAEPRIALAAARLGRALVKEAVAAAQERVRRGEIAPEAVVDAVLEALPATAATLTPVLNATGVLLHTNLGRAPLSAAARAALDRAAGTCDVELDLATGGRGPRGRGAVDALLAAVPAAAAAHLVNNGAAALALVATALAGGGREIVIARGELVEIGDGFRIPDLLTATGARLREVGTTNRVTPADYAAAVGPDTAMILKVHPSNFVVTGFTRAVGVDRAGRARRAGRRRHRVRAAGAASAAARRAGRADGAGRGATLVTASGDKLLGGPQAGLLLGAPGPGAELVARLRRHPLARALRVDKLTLAAMEATLRGPATPDRLALDAEPAALHARATRLAGPCAATASPPRPSARGHGRRGRRARRRAAQRRGRAARGVRGGAARRRAGGARPARPGPLPARPARAPPGRRRHAGRRRARVQEPSPCTSSPRPATSTTASRRWSGR